jgi:long-chain acyl-CoA synthetase
MGRQSDVINVGGVKVYPAEVESCIAELPFVEDVTVVGKQNVLLGQMVVAHIQISKQTDKRSAEVKIRKHCLSKLERYKLPAQILFNNRLLVNDRHKKIRNYA